MTAPVVLTGGQPHVHLSPQYAGMPAWKYRWNTVARSTCGHRYVRRYTWLAALIPLADHFPVWVRLRPWHVTALLRVAVRWPW